MSRCSATHTGPLTAWDPSPPSLLWQRLAESSRRSEAKLRAERARLAVRYGNQGKAMVQQKMGELTRPGAEHPTPEG